MVGLRGAGASRGSRSSKGREIHHEDKKLTRERQWRTA